MSKKKAYQQLEVGVLNNGNCYDHQRKKELSAKLLQFDLKSSTDSWIWWANPCGTMHSNSSYAEQQLHQRLQVPSRCAQLTSKWLRGEKENNVKKLKKGKKENWRNQSENKGILWNLTISDKACTRIHRRCSKASGLLGCFFRRKWQNSKSTLASRRSLVKISFLLQENKGEEKRWEAKR